MVSHAQNHLIHLFLYLFIQELFIDVLLFPDTFQGAEMVITVNKTDKFLVLMELTFQWGRWTTNKYITNGQWC